METHAAIYCRLSWAPDGSEEKVDRQEADCRALAERIGWRVNEDHVHVDNSASAWKRDRKRPGWDALLTALDGGEVNGIIVYHGDRLVRQPYDLEMLLRLTEQKRTRLASVSGMRDLSSADDRFILRIEVAQACRESDNISRRVRRGWQARARQGLPSAGGKRPFGFETDRVTIRKDEADLLADAASRLLAGQSRNGVTAWLNEVASTSVGGRWEPVILRKLLLSPRVVGLIPSQGELHDAAWEPIISRETQEELRTLYVTSSADAGYHGRARRHMLSGVAECYKCGHTVKTKPTGTRSPNNRIYHCNHCRGVGRNQEHVDAYIKGRVLAVVNEEGFLESLTDEDADDGLAIQIADLVRRRDSTREQLAMLADHPDLSPELIVRSLESFEQRISALRSQQSATTRQRMLRRVAGIDSDGWDALPLDLRAEVVKALFRVVILPATHRGPGFDPASVSVERRQPSRQSSAVGDASTRRVH